jgi:hypothetical protein
VAGLSGRLAGAVGGLVILIVALDGFLLMLGPLARL